MKKTRRALVFFIALAFATAFVFNYGFKPIELKADQGSNDQQNSLSTSGYLSYVESMTAYHTSKYGNASVKPELSNSIVIFGADYNDAKSDSGIASDGFREKIERLNVADYGNIYENSISVKAGKSSVVLQREGKITYDVVIPQSGFYNVKLNYYTYLGYSSSIERGLMIDGEYPFSDSENYSFSRTWQDKQEVRLVDGVETLLNAPVSSKDDKGNETITKIWRKDTNGNQLKPQQVEILNTKSVSYFKDSMGYVNEPFEYYLEAGSHTLTLTYTKEPLLIDAIEIVEIDEVDSYAKYVQELKQAHPDLNLTGAYTRIEAEAATTKSSPTLYPITDRSSCQTAPYSITKTYLNSIGGTNWKVLGDWIAWDFTVPANGYYNISMRAKQNAVRGMFSTRTVSIAEQNADGTMGEYEVLFDEMNQLQVKYNSKWKNITLGNGEEDYLFYFEAGKKYSIKLEVTLGDYAPLISRLQASIDELSAIYRRIIAYTTTSPDSNRDYELTTKFADLFYGKDELGNYTIKGEGQFNKVLAELKNISSEIKNISGGASDKTGVIDSVVVILNKFVEKPRTITSRLSTWSTNVSSLGSLLNELREAPLQIDYLMVHTPDVKLPRENANFFKALWNDIASFFASFFIDYSSIPETSDKTGAETTIEVWMTLGRDQANVVRNLIDTSFSSENGYAVNNSIDGKNINVELKLTGADVLLKATLAGIGPDVALNVDSTLPVNYGLRNAVLDLTVFDDFWDCVYAIPDGSEEYDDKYENVYMASSIRQFQFSALNPDGTVNEVKDEYFNSDISKGGYTPDELSSLINGIYALPEKQIFLMMFVRDDIMSELGLANMVPNTWDDMLDLVATLQAQQLQFYLPVNELGATALNPIFVSMLYQNDGRLYINNNMESGFKNEEAMEVFEFWTELYTNYGFPTAASFVNRFRTGEMPLGIAYYEMYNTLSVFAPELKGKWSFRLIPGTEKVDSLGNTYIDHTATASGTGAVLLKKECYRDGKVTKEGEAAWTFLKWWTSGNVQAQFGREMEGILGSAARHATANVVALKQLAWPAEDLKVLMNQWAQVHEMPQIAGSYIAGREIENAFREVINNNYNAREILYEYAQKVDTEINRKRSEFHYPLLNKND